MIPRRFWSASIERVPQSIQREIKNYIKNLDFFLDRAVGLLLWGPNGTGKTSAAALLGMASCRAGVSVLFATSETLRQAATGFRESRAVEADLYQRASTVDVLIIDDLGKEHSGATKYNEALLENLVRTRSGGLRITHATTNVNPQAGLGRIYPPSMLEVLRESILPLEVQGENQREKVLDPAVRRLMDD